MCLCTKNEPIPVLPLLTMPVLIPIYRFLDKLISVDIFGCG